MKDIKDLFNNIRIVQPTKSRRTERGDLIVAFTERLNAERGKAYKPLTIGYVSYLLSIKDSHQRMVFPLSELYFFYKKCKEAKNFTACFWYHVKPKL
jgi:hypothetical protein